jgi:hypothetical protein
MAIVAEVYPPRLEGWWEVAMGTMDMCAAVVEGIGAVWYPPKEVRLERWAVWGWLGDWVISIWMSLRLGGMLR